MKLAPGLGVLVLVAGCAHRPSVDASIGPLFEEDVAERARRDAPDLHARAIDARDRAREAERAGEIEAAQDHATEARLYWTAALVELERIDTERRRRDVEAREQAALEAARRDEARHRELADEVRRRRAGELAEIEARAAFDRASEREPNDRRRGDAVRDAARREAARVLANRARAMLAAAEALGAAASSLDPLRAALDRALEAPNGTVALADVEAAMGLVSARLGEARRAASPSTEAERASLLAEAAARGLRVEIDPRGAVIDLQATGDRVRDGTLRRAAELVLSFARGPAVLESGAPRSRVPRRATALRKVRDALVSAGVPAERVVVGEVTPDGSDGIRLVLPLHGS